MRRILLLAGLLMAPCLAPADTIIVTSAADAGPGTLRQAVLNAATGDEIIFAPALGGQTITLSSAVGINKDLEIVGPADQLTITGSGANRLFTIGSGVTVRLANLRLTGGRSNDATTGGGAIFSEGLLAVENCVIDTNSAFNDGGGIYASGGGFLSVSNSSIKGNTAGSGNASGGSGGGVFLSSASASIRFSTIESNQSTKGTASQCGGGVYTAAPVSEARSFRLQSSTVLANQAGDRGAGLCLGTSGADLENSTISGNVAQGDGGGLYALPLIRLRMVYATVAGNTAAAGGGVYLSSTITEAQLERSIFADNTAATGPDVEGTPTSSFSNLLTSSVSWGDPTDQVVSDAGLGPLADNGGPTLTHRPTPTSPAIDLVVSSSSIFPADQRGFSDTPPGGRCVDLTPLNTSATCDAGAVEVGAMSFRDAFVNAKVFLEGPYVEAAMPFNSAAHAFSGRLPVNQPFSGPPWNYAGTETWNGIVNVSDWVLIELRETPDGPAVQRAAALVGSDGSIPSSGFFVPLTGATAGDPPYHIVLRFRNHLDLISPAPVLAFEDSYTWTAHPDNGLTFNPESTVDAGTFFAARAGDLDADNQITGLDALNVWLTQDGSSGGYFPGDLDFDGDVDPADLLLLWLPNNGW